jgi:hypothetical protein
MKKTNFPFWDTPQQRIFIIFKYKIFSKMILTHESGSQEDQFDEKNRGKKSFGTLPLSIAAGFVLKGLSRQFKGTVAPDF